MRFIGHGSRTRVAWRRPTSGKLRGWNETTWSFGRLFDGKPLEMPKLIKSSPLSTPPTGGRRALATSPHLEQAKRTLDRERQAAP